MIELNQEHHLGRKAYLLMASRRMTVGVAMLLVAAILLSASGILSGLIAGLLAIGGAAPSSATAIASSYVSAVVLGLLILSLVVIVASLIVTRLQYANYSFTFEEFDLKLRRGIVSLKEVSIPYRQMQDVDVERGILHRMTGTSRVIIDSGGHEESDEKNETDIMLDPIDKEMANEIRLMLQRKIGVQVVEGEKEADNEAERQSRPPSGIPGA